jgi:AcrR family transcriptional regulator
VYLRFSSKEDVLVALAERASRKRIALMSRGADFDGRPRERLLAVGEAVSLFARLLPEDSRILHTTMGPLKEKASPERLQALVYAERDTLDIVRSIAEDAVACGDLVLRNGATIEEILLGAWGLVDGVQALIEGGSLQASLNIEAPFHTVWRFFNVAADGYGWRPLFSEWNYEETLVRIRKEVFPKEAQQLYGEGAWYGDRH